MTPPQQQVLVLLFPLALTIVFGVTVLHYLNRPTPSQMYVSEVFKVLGGRIVRIDAIGLMMPGVSTLGFSH